MIPLNVVEAAMFIFVDDSKVFKYIRDQADSCGQQNMDYIKGIVNQKVYHSNCRQV
jgi:hypothetical protein